MLHEQWTSPGMQRHTRITLCNLVQINFDSYICPFPMFMCIGYVHLYTCIQCSGGSRKWRKGVSYVLSVRIVHTISVSRKTIRVFTMSLSGGQLLYCTQYSSMSTYMQELTLRTTLSNDVQLLKALSFNWRNRNFSCVASRARKCARTNARWLTSGRDAHSHV